jgi:hypothetical protein
MPTPRVGQVQVTQDGRGTFAGSGFVVYGNDGLPAAIFGFLKDDDAHIAIKKMHEIIALCQHISKT